MRVRTASESSITDTQQLGTEGALTTNRTITDMIELTTSLPQTVSLYLFISKMSSFNINFLWDS